MDRLVGSNLVELCALEAGHLKTENVEVSKTVKVDLSSYEVDMDNSMSSDSSKNKNRSNFGDMLARTQVPRTNYVNKISELKTSCSEEKSRYQIGVIFAFFRKLQTLMKVYSIN